MTDPLGLESGVVHLVEYDSRWPALYLAERQRLLASSGLPVRLEHIGSTSIPGLCAKPVLDIVAGRSPDAPATAHIAAFERAGYTHRGERGVRGREFFRRGDPRVFHVHLVEEDGTLWREYLAFRDYLRAHAGAASEYAELKRSLAARFPRDRESYMDGKTSFVTAILARVGLRHG